MHSWELALGTAPAPAEAAGPCGAVGAGAAAALGAREAEPMLALSVWWESCSGGRGVARRPGGGRLEGGVWVRREELLELLNSPALPWVGAGSTWKPWQRVPGRGCIPRGRHGGLRQLLGTFPGADGTIRPWGFHHPDFFSPPRAWANMAGAGMWLRTSWPVFPLCSLQGGLLAQCLG